MPNEAIPEAMLAQMREMTQLMISVTLAKRAGNFPAASAFAAQLLEVASRAGVKATCVAASVALDEKGNFSDDAIDAARPKHTS